MSFFAVAPPLHLDNILPLLDSIIWSELGRCLYVPHPILMVIGSDYHTEEERKKAVVLYWLLRDPFVSWRRLISSLDRIASGIQIANKIRNYAEKLTGIAEWDYTLSVIV